MAAINSLGAELQHLFVDVQKCPKVVSDQQFSHEVVIPWLHYFVRRVAGAGC